MTGIAIQTSIYDLPLPITVYDISGDHGSGDHDA